MIVVGTAAPSILDVADREFVLRVCGSPRHGQIVRLRSPKCTIGSGPRCTLRLRAVGVQPVHCLVLRGAAGTVIRRLAADTRLNGRAFGDTRLVPGDRLSVGPIEFEVIDPDQANDTSCEPQLPPDLERPTESVDRRLQEIDALAGRLSHQEHSLEQRQAALDEQQQTLHDQQQALAEQAEALRRREDELGERERAISDQQEAPGKQQGTLSEQRRAPAEQERTVGEQRSSDEQQGALDEQRAALDEQRGALDQQKQALDQAQQTLHERSEQIERAQAELESQRKAFDEERRRWEADRTASQVDSGRQGEEVETRLAELEAQREALQNDRARREQEHAEAKRQLAAQTEEIEAGRRTLNAQRQDLQQARDRWTEKHDEARNKLQAESADLEQRRAELEAHRADLDQCHAAVDARQADLDDRQAAMDARQAELDARSAELEARQAELDERQELLDARESEIDESCQGREAVGAAADVAREQPSGEADREEDIQFEDPSEGAPESSEAVLRRLGIAASFDHEEEEEEERPGHRSPHAVETLPHAAETPNVSRAASEEDDESIDDYMARLLDRVRAGTGQLGGPTAYVPSAPPAPAPTPAAPCPAQVADPPPETPDPEPDEKKELSPRAVAPERSVNLRAMRDLANQSAQAAIDHHTRRRLLGLAANKLLVAIVALAAGAILLWVWWTKTHDQVTLYAAVAGLAVALIWLGQYVLLGGSMLLKRPRREKADCSDDERERDAGG